MSKKLPLLLSRLLILIVKYKSLPKTLKSKIVYSNNLINNTVFTVQQEIKYLKADKPKLQNTKEKMANMIKQLLQLKKPSNSSLRLKTNSSLNKNKQLHFYKKSPLKKKESKANLLMFLPMENHRSQIQNIKLF